MRKRILAAWRETNPARRTAVLTGGVLLLWLAFFSLVHVWRERRHVQPESAVTLGNFRRLHLGMTEEQVKASLGVGKKRNDKLHRVMQYVGNDCEIEILFDGGRALSGKWMMQRKAEGVTKEQVEEILAAGNKSIGKGRWVWSRNYGVDLLFDKESPNGRNIAGGLTKDGFWLQEELRRKPLTFLEWVETYRD
jgi:hypothetical protein